MSVQTNTSVDQIFDALDVLSRTPEPVGVIDIAHELELPTSSAHRLLVTLQEVGFARRDSTRTKYELGVRAHQLVHGLFRQYRLRQASEPFIHRLVAALGETALLDVRVGWYSVRMAGLEGTREIHAGTRIGQTQRLGDSTPGKSILAFLGDDVERYSRWAGHRIDRVELEAIREAGFAHSLMGDERAGVLALPLRAGGRAVAALSLDGTGPAVSPEPRAAELQRAQRITADLEALIAREPDVVRDPLAHFGPDALDLSITRT